ncbi:MAG: cupin domain-containing protein [Mycobacteriaceae bacterium]|nr:cupin domain-containing protein [Mycobacteriaceae bacterium]
MADDTRQPVYVPAGEGDTVFLLGDTYTTLLTGPQTGNAFALLEALVPAQTGPPPHVHHAEDETFVLLDGELEFHVDHDVHQAKPGSVIFVPRGTTHHFANVGDGLARMLFMYSPSGMEGMFGEIGAPGRRGEQGPPLTAADVAALASMAERYRFSIVAE